MIDKKIGVGFGVMLMRGNKILLGRRHDDPEKADSLLNGAGKWTMPGGKLDFGETFESGAMREVHEETGVSVKSVKVICINQDMFGNAHFVTVGLYCENFTGEPAVMEPDEITQWAWFDLDSLPSPLYSPSAKLLENYKRKMFYIAS